MLWVRGAAIRSPRPNDTVYCTRLQSTTVARTGRLCGLQDGEFGPRCFQCRQGVHSVEENWQGLCCFLVLYTWKLLLRHTNVDVWAVNTWPHSCLYLLISKEIILVFFPVAVNKHVSPMLFNLGCSRIERPTWCETRISFRDGSWQERDVVVVKCELSEDRWTTHRYCQQSKKFVVGW